MPDKPLGFRFQFYLPSKQQHRTIRPVLLPADEDLWCDLSGNLPISIGAVRRLGMKERDHE